MRKYRVGIVGVRRGGNLLNQFTAFPVVEITALCDLLEERLAAVGKLYNVPDHFLFTDYEAFLEAPIDIVVVSTPIQIHADQVIKSLESGKHVLSEVTAAWTIEQCEQIVNTVKRTGKIYMLAENNCYYHFIREWKKWIGQGRLGKIFYAESEYMHDIQNLIRDEKTGETFWRVERPPIYYCSHNLGPLLYLMEDRVIQACGLHTGYNILLDLGPGCLSMEVALFKTQKGSVIKILRSQVAYRWPPMEFYCLYGTKGYVENGRAGGWERTEGKLFVIDEMFREVGHQIIDCSVSDPQAPPEALRGGHNVSAEYYMIRDFIEAVNNNTRPPLDVIKAMDMTLPGICAHESAMNGGSWIDVPLFNW